MRLKVARRGMTESLEEYYKRTGMVGDLALYEWASVELAVDILVAGEFALKPGDERTMLFDNIPFGRKLDFLKKRGVVNEAELNKIRPFQELRNRLFHKKGLRTFMFHYDRQTKREIIRTCTDAYEAAWDVLMRRTKVTIKVPRVTIRVTPSDLKSLE